MIEHGQTPIIEHSQTPADELLEQWPHLRRSHRVAEFERLPRQYMDDFFLELDARAQADLVVALPEGERRMFVRLLAPDDGADLVQESPQQNATICWD
jgi:magnesium transporter